MCRLRFQRLVNQQQLVNITYTYLKMIFLRKLLEAATIIRETFVLDRSASEFSTRVFSTYVSLRLRLHVSTTCFFTRKLVLFLCKN